MDDEFEEIPPPSNDQEPSEEEIVEYFKWLGGDPQKDRNLIWIARNALKEPLPEGWKLYRKKDGTADPFYFNTLTGESLWDHPKDQEYKALFLQEKKKTEKGLESIPRPLPSLGNYHNDSSSQLFDIAESENDNSDHESSANFEQQLNEKRQSLNLELQKLIAEHNENIEKEKARYEKTLSNLRAKYEKEISDEEEEKKRKLADIKSKYQKEIDDLQDGNISLIDKEEDDEEIDKLKDSLNTKRLEAIQKNEEEMAEIQQQQKSIEKQKEKLKKLEEELEEQKQQLIETNNEEIEELNKKHQQNIDKIKKKQQREIQELKENFDPEQQIQELQKELKKKQKELQAKYDTEIEELKSQHEAEMSELQKSGSNKDSQFNYNFSSYLTNSNQLNSEKSSEQFQKQLEELKQDQEKEIAKQKKKHQKLLSQNEERFQHELELAKTKQETEMLKEENQLRRDYESKKKTIEDQLKKDIENQKKIRLEQLKLQLEKEIESTQERQFEEIKHSNENKKKEMIINFQDELNELRKSQEKEMSKLRKQHQKQIKDENLKFNQDLTINKTKHESEKMKIEDQYRRELDQVRLAMIEKKKRDEFQETGRYPYQQQQQQQDNLIDFGEKTMSKFKKLQYKMEKIKSQFETTYGNFPVSLKELLDDVNNVCQGYKNLISEQNKTMSKMIGDFQQQTSMLARQFQTSLSDVENSYRAALNAYANGGGIGYMGGQFQLQPPPIVQTDYGRSRRRHQDSEDSEDDYPADRKVKVVYQGSRRRKKYHDDYE